MSLLASTYEFEGGGLYDNYRRYPFFETRAKYLHANTSGRILVAGCGWGYLVDELSKLGRDAVGIDASEYAIRRGRQELPHLKQKLKHVDMLDIPAVRKLGKFDVCVTEDVLPCAEDHAELMRMTFASRALAKRVIHICTPWIEELQQDKRLLLAKNWQEILSPDLVLDSDGVPYAS